MSVVQAMKRYGTDLRVSLAAYLRGQLHGADELLPPGGSVGETPLSGRQQPGSSSR